MSISGLESSAILWSSNFGIIYRFDYEGGNRLLLKGVFKSGVVFGDTTVFVPPEEWEIQKDYFPYSNDDILVFTVKDSLGNDLSNSFIEFIQDSIDKDGSTWYSLNVKGNKPLAGGFKVDTLRNVYATNWWDNNSGPWLIYNAFNSQSGPPWVSYKNESFFILSMLLGIEIRSVFGQNFWQDTIFDVFTINNYEASDSTIQAYDDYPNHLMRTYSEWTEEYGIFKKYEFDTGLEYILKGGVIDGIDFGDTTIVITATEFIDDEILTFSLYQNYPNPFNPRTTITYRLNTSGVVELRLYDITGRIVKELVNEYKPLGEHSFTLNAYNLSSGTYILRAILGDKTEIIKITLIK